MTQETVDTIIASVDFATIVIGIGGVAAAMMLPKVAIAGARKLMSLIR